MKEKGSAIPLYVALILISMVLVFALMYFIIGKPVDITVSTFENNAPSNTPIHIFNDLKYVWAAIPIIGVIAVIIWAFAKTHQEDVGGVYGA